MSSNLGPNFWTPERRAKLSATLRKKYAARRQAQNGAHKPKRKYTRKTSIHRGHIAPMPDHARKIEDEMIPMSCLPKHCEECGHDIRFQHAAARARYQHEQNS